MSSLPLPPPASAPALDREATAHDRGWRSPRSALRPSELRRHTWNLAWPVILTMLSESLVGLVDTLMVGRLGADSVAAVGVGAQILSGVSAVMMAVGTGTLALVARHIGAEEPESAAETVAQSILAGLALATLVAVPVILFPHAIVRAFGVEPSVVDLGAGFTRLVMLSVPFSATLFVVASGLRGAGDTRTPLAIGLLVNTINILGNWVLIFGRFGLPAMGVRGSALATTIAFGVGASLGVALLLGGRLRMRITPAQLAVRWAPIRRVLAIGYPAAAEQVLMQIGFFVYLLFAVEYGTSAIAAYFIGVRILALSFLPGLGFAASAAALVGQSLGAGNPRRAAHAGWVSTWLAVALMSSTGIVLFVLAEPIAAIFVADPAVIQGTVSFIHMLAAAQPLMAIDFTLGGALRGAGDTRFPLVTVLVAFYGCRLGYAYVVTHVLGLGLAWLWSALIGDYIARAALKAWRFHGGAWKHVRL